MRIKLFTTLVSLTVALPLYADDFAALDAAIPSAQVANIAPVFDFDGDGCLPSAGISRSGQKNGGLKASFSSITAGCRSGNFLETSNTVHRAACKTHNGKEYCAHIYSLYFEKDQVSWFGGGHRHDWEHATVWTIDGTVTHGSYSAHGDSFTKSASELPFENGHLKIVYHKDGILTHAFRFAKSVEAAENPYGYWVTPAITSWWEMYGDGLSNQQMRDKLTSFDYGSGNLPVKDSNFLNNINNFKPAGFPTFSSADTGATAGY